MIIFLLERTAYRFCNEDPSRTFYFDKTGAFNTITLKTYITVRLFYPSKLRYKKMACIVELVQHLKNYISALTRVYLPAIRETFIATKGFVSVCVKGQKCSDSF